MNALSKTTEPVALVADVVIKGEPSFVVPGEVLQGLDKIAEATKAAAEEARAAGKVECANSNCGQWFFPRKGGGKPQRFCKPECRAEYHLEHKAEPDDDLPEPTASERRAMLIRGVEDFDAKFKPESPAELVDRMAMAGLLAPAKPERRTTYEPTEWEGCISRQAETWVKTIKEGNDFNVEVVQESNAAEGSERIYVTAANAVELARSILWAAGFRAVGIYAVVAGGHADIEDGARAYQFEWLDAPTEPEAT